MRRLNVSPAPVRMKLMRTSLSARARPTNLSYFSHATGIESMNAERNMLAMEINKANPVRPAYLTRVNLIASGKFMRKKRTRSNTPFSLKTSYSCKAYHCD